MLRIEGGYLTQPAAELVHRPVWGEHLYPISQSEHPPPEGRAHHYIQSDREVVLPIGHQHHVLSETVQHHSGQSGGTPQAHLPLPAGEHSEVTAGMPVMVMSVILSTR